MRRRVLLASLLSLVALVPARAQTVRGVIVDDSTKLPVIGAVVTLLDPSGKAVNEGTRSDSGGRFIIHAARPGTFRVRAARIGYQPLTSDAVRLTIGQLAVVRLRMTTLAQQLIPVRIVERRPMTAAELMSTTGFDLRQSKGLGTFLGGERLAAMGHDGLKEIFASQLQPTVYIRPDSVLGDVIRMRKGLGECAPEIYLDGRLLATAPEPVVEWDTSGLMTALDSIRFRMRVEGEDQRIAASQGYALSVLSNLRAIDLHGIEAYRSNQLPPASLGGWFGLTKTAIRTCGTVAVWTKGGLGLPLASARNRRVNALQIITGNVVSYETGFPVPNVAVTLLSDGRDVVGETVHSDARGAFTIRTNRIGPLRLHAGSVGYNESTTPSVPLAADEMVVVKLYVSALQPVVAPLGVAARLRPKDLQITSAAGFTYRQARGLGGTFFTGEDIERLGARRLADLARPLQGVRMDGAAPTDQITFLRGDDLPRCRPLYYIDGKPVRDEVEATIGALAMGRVLGVEIYTDPEDAPPGFADIDPECGVIAIWMKGTTAGP